MCDYAILAGNEKSSGRHKVKHKTVGQLSLLCCDVTSFSCMSQTLNQWKQIPLLIYYKTLNQLHVQLIHTLIHKSTRNNIFFFLPEIHSFLFSGNPPGNSKSSNHPIFHFIHESINVSELMQCMCFQLCIGVWIITACIAFWIVQNLKFLKRIIFVYISKANEWICCDFVNM